MRLSLAEICSGDQHPDRPRSTAANNRGSLASFPDFGRPARTARPRSAASGRYRHRSPQVRLISRPTVERCRPIARAISLSDSPRATPTQIRSRSSNVSRNRECSARRLSINASSRTRAIVSREHPNRAANPPIDAPSTNLSAISPRSSGRNHRYNRPIRPPLTQHENQIVLRRPDESTAAIGTRICIRLPRGVESVVWTVASRGTKPGRTHATDARLRRAGDRRLGVDLVVAALERADESVDYRRVELGARAADELLAGGERGHAGAVGPVGDHRLVGVGDRQDPRLERDLVADGSLRVPPAVDPLVVRTDPIGDVGEAGVLEDARADLRMAHDLPPLGLVQGPRLVQNRVGDAELAEVVKDTGGVDALDAALGHIERERGLAGVRADRAGVPRGAGVAHVERLRE